MPKFEIALHMFLRYGFGGFFAAFLASVADPEWTKDTIDSLGAVVAPLSIFLIGTSIYVVYRYVLGHAFFLLMRGCLALWYSLAPYGSGDRYAYEIFDERGVRFWWRDLALSKWRRTKLTPEDRGYYDLLHAEIGLLYIAAMLLLVAGIVVGSRDVPGCSGAWSPYIFWSLIALVFAILGDCFLVHRYTPSLLNADNNLESWLEDSGFTTKA